MLTKEILIIGAGISGLHTAHELKKKNINFLLCDSRGRTGGRILSHHIKLASSKINSYAYFDLGPAWFWPDQRRILTLISELELSEKIFYQYSEGEALYEDGFGKITRGLNYVSMEGSCRLEGGLSQITDRLASNVEEQNISLRTQLKSIEQREDSIIAHCLKDKKEFPIKCKKIILAIPPRITAQNITFKPYLELKTIQQFKSISTWMAGHAKLMVIYDKPFWRKNGLSGDALSMKGPLGEIHDASTKKENAFALFGFFNVEAKERKEIGEKHIIKASIKQLIKLFGKQAENPIDVIYKDWSQDIHTSSNLDNKLSIMHPDFEISQTSKNIIWSGSETAIMGQAMNGYIEGALQASERALDII